jgi:glycosyltransferase involved in cell wall biosynthesis
MRILICNWKDRRHPAAGGAEVYTDECARRWAAAGHHVTLICSAVDGEPDHDERPGYRVIRGGSRFGVYRHVATHLRIFGHRYDVIVDEINTRPFFAHRHAPSTPSVALAFQVAREVWFPEMPLPAAILGRYVLEPMWLRQYARIPALTISRSSLESLRAYGLRDLSIVPVGVDVPFDITSSLPRKADVLTFVHCGRLVEAKRPGDAIRAFAETARRLGEPAELHLIGAGPLESRLRRCGVPGVVVHGAVGHREKFELMARAHAHLCTSTREGWGLVVSEAAAVGTRTIGYDVDGLRDSIAAARGVVVPARVDALSDAMVDLASSFRDGPFRPIPHGGAVSWDAVADAVLAHLVRVAGSESGVIDLSVLPEERPVSVERSVSVERPVSVERSVSVGRSVSVERSVSVAPSVCAGRGEPVDPVEAVEAVEPSGGRSDRPLEVGA